MKPLMVAAPTEATDDQLVVAAQQGSDAAFDALFRRYRDRITAYVRSIVSDHARAEDIVQDVFMSALRSLRATDREVAFKPWVYEIAKNACIDQIRRARRTSEVSIDSDDFSPVDEGRLSVAVASTDAAYSTREDLDTLRMAFNDLPDAQREVLVSRELEGLSYETIATNTGLSLSAVESMLFRARRTLKDGFDDIATGERCQRMQTVMAQVTDGRMGIRQERRLVRHLGDCAACRREAIALGLDDLALGAPSRSRSALSRVAGFLPIPAFLRRRFFDGSGLLGAAGQSGAAEGLSLAGKAAVVLAAAAIAAGGAGVAHQAGAIGGGPPAEKQSSSGSGGGAGDSATGGGAGGGQASNGGGGQTGGGSAGGGSGAAGQGPGGLGDAGGLANGVGGKAGTGAGGAVGGVTNGVGGTVGGTVNGVGGTVDKTVTGTTGTVDKTVTGVTGTVDKTVKGVTGATGTGGTLDKPVTGVTGTVDKTVKDTTGTLDKTVKETTGTVTGLANTVTSPTTAPTTTTVPKLLP